MNQYEIAVLYDPGLEVDLSKGEERVKKIIADSNGEIIATDNWGKRKLAYSIKHNDFAVYVFYTVKLSPQSINKVEAALNITNEVIRFLIVKSDLKAIAKAEKEKEIKASRIKQDDLEQNEEDA